MNNFIRLVKFAWPYRLRFGLSLGCAVMVAILWFANISAVYPLLQILFYHQNCQRWISQQISESDARIECLTARRTELASISEMGRASDWSLPQLGQHMRDIEHSADEQLSQIRAAERSLADDPVGARGGTERDAVKRELPTLQQAHLVATARADEIKNARDLYKAHDAYALERRTQAVGRDLAKAEQHAQRLRWLEPWIQRFLPNDGFRTLVLLIAAVFLGIGLKGVFQFLQDVLVANVTQLSLFNIRNHFFRRTLALDLGSFSDSGTADLMARFTNDVDSVAQGLNTLLSKMVREPLRIVSCLTGALLLNWRLTLLTLIIVPISAVTTYKVGKVLKRAVRRSLESMSNIYKILQECFQGIRVVKAYTRERSERRRFFLETKTLFKKSVRVAKIDALSDPVLELLSLSTVAIALLAGSYLVLYRTTQLHLGFFRLQLAEQPMMIEDLLTLYAMLAGMSDPIRKLANVHSKIQRAAAASDRICGLMDREPKVADKVGAPRLARHKQSVEIEGLWFGYDQATPVLKGIDLKVRHGERIALVGPNGCGKSTLVQLIARFWDVERGAVRVDGHDVRDVTVRSLRDQIGFVTQETVVFEGTIADNIGYGRPQATRDEIIEAAKQAYAHQFVSALPDGYDTRLNERGLTLSGGQRQRLALARAIVRDPAILLLDEATSAIDLQDEALIRKALDHFTRGRTTIFITHSLSGIQSVDRIVLMNSGRIEAIGSDTELRRSSNLYRRLLEIHTQRESA
jgi:ABC-type multidrug transport system fused ATPase/permease subunit